MTAGHVLAYLPSPPQGVWNLGPLPLRAYALFIIIGIVVAVWWSDRRWQERGGRPGDVLDVALIAVPFGLIGGRIYHVITDWWRYFGDGGKGFGAVFQVWDGGLGIWGAVAFGALGGWVGCRWKRIKLPAFGDAIAPAILLAQAIGRIGNYFNQELYGEPTTLPWGLELFDRVDPDTGRHGITAINGVSNGDVLAVVHPTFLYELLWNLLIVALLVFVDRRFRIGHGRLFALYVAGYCVGRFGIELMRSDEATHILGLRVNVLVAALVFLGAALYVLMAPRGRETGLSMYWPDRADELAAEGHLGYVPPALDDDADDDADPDGAGFAVHDDSAEDDDPADDPVDVSEEDAVDDSVDADDQWAPARFDDTEPADTEPADTEPADTDDAESTAAECESVDSSDEQPRDVELENAADEQSGDTAEVDVDDTRESAAAGEPTVNSEGASVSSDETSDPDADELDADAPEAGETPSEPGPGYTIVSSEDGLDLEGISVVEESSGHDAGAIEVRPAASEKSDDDDDG